MVKFKLIFDKDDEVKWLNEEARKGNAFKKFFMGFYFFEKCEEDEYLYDIDLLTKYNDYGNFKDFMKDADIEVLMRWYRWVYVRKINDSKGFELYSDIDSKVEHYIRIKKMFRVAFIIELVCLGIEIFVPLIQKRMDIENAIFIAMIAFFTIAVYGGYSKAGEKIKFYQLQKEISNS